MLGVARFYRDCYIEGKIVAKYWIASYYWKVILEVPVYRIENNYSTYRVSGVRNLVICSCDHGNPSQNKIFTDKECVDKIESMNEGDTIAFEGHFFPVTSKIPPYEECFKIDNCILVPKR